MSPLISIIVPVYNLEKFINKCVDSILGQSYKFLEIIIIDDGSCDSSSILMGLYPIIDSRIVTVYHKNCGVSEARNLGLEISTGNYIGFVDGDDWIDHEMYETLLYLITYYHVDSSSIQFDLRYFTKDESTVVYNNKEAIIDVINNNLYGNEIWRKLFTRESIIKNNIRFLSYLKNGEDMVFTISVLLNIINVACSSKTLYHYFVRDNSATHTINRSYFTSLASYEIAYNMVSSSDLNITFFDAMIVEYCISLVNSCSVIQDFDKKCYKSILAHILLHLTPHVFGGLSLKNKASLLVMFVNINLYCKIHSFIYKHKCHS